jgi:hypothetical protein
MAYFIDAPTFAQAKSVFIDQDLTTFAVDGWYAFDGIARFQTNGRLGPAQNCPLCPATETLTWYTLNDATGQYASQVESIQLLVFQNGQNTLNTSSIPSNGAIGLYNGSITYTFHVEWKDNVGGLPKVGLRLSIGTDGVSNDVAVQEFPLADYGQTYTLTHTEIIAGSQSRYFKIETY